MDPSSPIGPRPRAPRSRAGGFTLVELVVTLAVVGILIGVGVPMYVARLPETRLRSAAHDLLGELRMARSLAVANDTPYFVCFSGNGAVQVDRVDDPAAAADCASASTPTERSADLASAYPGVRYGFAAGVADCPAGGGVAADPLEFTSDRAVFTPKGASTTGSQPGAPVQAVGRIYLTNPDTVPQQTYCLEVQGTVGNVRLLKWDAGAGGWAS